MIRYRAQVTPRGGRHTAGVRATVLLALLVSGVYVAVAVASYGVCNENAYPGTALGWLCSPLNSGGRTALLAVPSAVFLAIASTRPARRSLYIVAALLLALAAALLGTFTLLDAS